MATLNLRDVPEELAYELRVEAAKASMGVKEYCVAILKARGKVWPVFSLEGRNGAVSVISNADRGVSKKIAGDLVTGAAQEGGGTPDLPRLGKAQDEVTIYSGPHVVTARDGSTAFCDVRYCKLCASTEEEWRQRSADICGTCGEVHVAGDLYNHNFVHRGKERIASVRPASVKEDRWAEEMAKAEDGALIGAAGSPVAYTKSDIEADMLGEAFRLHENKLEGVGGGEKIVAEGSANEAGTATGKDRRNSETVSEGNDGGKSSAVGVGKSKVNMAALRDICEGNVSVPKDAFAEYGNPSFEPVEVDLCGFKSYNEIDGEWYFCGKEVHEYPKVKHGNWEKI